MQGDIQCKNKARMWGDDQSDDEVKRQEEDTI